MVGTAMESDRTLNRDQRQRQLNYYQLIKFGIFSIKPLSGFYVVKE